MALLFCLLLSQMLAAAAAAAAAISTPLEALRAACLPEQPLRQVHAFANDTVVENIAVRANGHLLVSLLFEGELRQVDPAAPNATTPELVHFFNGSTMINGIAEISPDVFAVSTNPGALWTVDLNGAAPAVAQVASVPDAGLLNGVAALPAADDAAAVLVADSVRGAVWRVDTRAGTARIVHADERTMAAVFDPAANLSIGINGIRLGRDGFLYYSNTPKQLLARVRVDPASGEALAPYEILAQGFVVDDFALAADADAAAYVASGSVIRRVFFNGTVDVVAGSADSGVLAGASSAAFGRTAWDAGLLYVTTTGAGVSGGKIVAVHA
ncbi:Six-bladed beta-propeller -like protein [Neofusicoccum parvum]|nr:Six-bladed beta-propeller -like protein [Neofusicoccum parvum]